MHIRRVAAFCEADQGGNPAGVVLCGTLPEPARMQAIAAEIGYSETVFAAPCDAGWRVRFFAPRLEIPFCGHATIALGAVLAETHGPGVFGLQLNHARITVEGRIGHAALQSPPTRSVPADPAVLAAALALFSLHPDALDPRLPPTLAEAGARHLILGLGSRERLAAMSYPFEAGRALMTGLGIVTVALVQAETMQRFHARNAFAAGGVVEDPATGAAAAALAGLLRDLDWPHGGAIEILQGYDMGMPSRLHAAIPMERGSSIRVSGAVRQM